MKKMLKLLCIGIFIIASLVSSAAPASAVFLFGMDAVMPRVGLDFALPRIAVPQLPPIDIVPPMIGPQIDAAAKYVPTKRGDRIEFKSKKEAYEAAKRAGGGKEPRHDPSGHNNKETRDVHGRKTNTKPHYHPAGTHDHYYYHRVVSGDTLTGIAQKHKTTVAELMRINSIKNPDSIIIGQQLKIPGKPEENVRVPRPCRRIRAQTLAELERGGDEEPNRQTRSYRPVGSS